ncbi:hypothetical protein A3F06_03985 [candidate division TM6 bacterium RIFCSPHIGHO2_12_FULL_36_22]|nr:MAG: hypothetical protein A3F06_03985 [candidate division TM6 bacterium RIFCSPHIGHO2_12_FULL_36_22]
MKITKTLISLFIFFVCFGSIQAESIEISFGDAVCATPFEKVVQQCMQVQEHLTQLVQKSDNEYTPVVYEQLTQLHAECVRMHDANMLVPSEDADYLNAWFGHLSQQVNMAEICPCMIFILEQSRRLVA